MSVAHFQLATALMWTLVTACLVPSVALAFSRNRTRLDEWKAAFFFVGLLLVAFPSRWLIIPDDQASWKMLYTIGIALACYVLLLLWNGRPDRS